MGVEMKSKVLHSEPKDACDGSTNLHILQFGHQVFAGGSQDASAVESDTNSTTSVTKCGTNCKTRGQERPLLCTMCLLELAASSEENLGDEALQVNVSEDILGLLETPLGRALRASMPNLKNHRPAKTVGVMGFVNQLLKPGANLSAVERPVEKATAEVGGEVIEKPVDNQGETAEPVNKSEQTLFVEQPGQDDALAQPLSNPHNSEMDLLGSRTTRDVRGGRVFKPTYKSGLFGAPSLPQYHGSQLTRRAVPKSVLATQNDKTKVTKPLVRSDGRATQPLVRLCGDAFYQKCFKKYSNRTRTGPMLLDSAVRSSLGNAQVDLPNRGCSIHLRPSGTLSPLTGKLFSQVGGSGLQTSIALQLLTEHGQPEEIASGEAKHDQANG